MKFSLIGLGILLGSLLIGGVASSAPFFDNDLSTIYAPAFPGLHQVDHSVLELCGRWGTKLEKKAFAKWVAGAKGEPWFLSLKSQIDPSVYSRDKVSFEDWLSRVWTQRDGFLHIFCGEPNKQLGGMHYFARYWQAQEQGWARMLLAGDPEISTVCRKLRSVAEDGVFTLAIGWKNRQHAEKVKCVSGYHLDLNADELLLLGTKAFVSAVESTPNVDGACLYHAEKTEGFREHYSLLVIQNRAIRTFYPLTEKDVSHKRRKGMGDCKSGIKGGN